MGANRIRSIAGALQRALAQASELTPDDASLLGAFVERWDGSAFEELVRRHGPMVLGVCLRVLGHRQDAEDAFQATFLVLAHKAGSVSPRNLVGNWLHGVALQTAVRARAEAMKRRGREVAMARPPERAAVPEAGWDDVAAVLDEEIGRLPEHYRAVVLLCDVEGRSRKDTAEQLGCPEGSVASRLARARAMLARRLAGRGVTLSAGSLALLLGQHAAGAAVPATLLHATAEACVVVASGTTLVTATSPAVTSLAEEVLKAMLFAKLKIVSLTVLVLALAGAAGALGIGVAGGRDLVKPAALGPRGPVSGGEQAGVRAEVADNRPLTAKELTGKWSGEAENINGIRKLAATLDFDLLLPFRPEVRCSLRYATEMSSEANIGLDLATIDDGANARVNLRFENGKVLLGHLARGKGGTITLTMLPEIEERNMKGESIYRRFEGLVLRQEQPPAPSSVREEKASKEKEKDMKATRRADHEAADLSSFPALEGKVVHSLGYPNSYCPPEAGHAFRLDLAKLKKLKHLPFDLKKESYLPVPGGTLFVDEWKTQGEGKFAGMRLLAKGEFSTLRIDISPKPGLGPRRVLVWVVVENGGVIDHVTLVDCEAGGEFPRRAPAAGGKGDIEGRGS